VPPLPHPLFTVLVSAKCCLMLIVFLNLLILLKLICQFSFKFWWQCLKLLITVG
jgi:hypothetical protein